MQFYEASAVQFKCFPQALWKSLWKTAFQVLQVPELFRLLAFCTCTRHVRQPVRLQYLAHVKQRFLVRHARTFLSALLCAALAASSCVKMARQTPAAPAQDKVFSQTQALPRININNASRTELEKLPGIGAGLATRIIAHRERFGSFRRAEHLIVVRGISEHRFQAMRDFITVE